MSKIDTVDTELLMEEILSSAKALKEATLSQNEILESMTLNKLDRVLGHKDVLIDKIRTLHRTLKDRGLDFSCPKGLQLGDTNDIAPDDNQNGNGAKVWGTQVNNLRKTVERTIREIINLEADSQKKLLALKQHVRGILLDIQNRRKMLRGYAVRNNRPPRILDTKM
jgi:hypothetical protein